MKSLLIAFACIALFTLPAIAQPDPPMRRGPPMPPPAVAEPAPAPQPQAQPQITIPSEYHLILAPTDIDALGAAINELPARVANPLAKRIQDQINTQVSEATRKAAEAKAAEPKK